MPRWPLAPLRADEREALPIPNGSETAMSTDRDTNANGAAGNEAERRLQIQKIYLKDASFESPEAPGVFTDAGERQPKIDLQLNTETQRLANGLYEIVLVITVTGAEEDKNLFLIEVRQAGLFQVEGFARDEHGHLLGAYCPSMLFPYAREAIADLVQKGGLPQLALQPINFDALYAQHVQKQQESARSSEAAQ